MTFSLIQHVAEISRVVRCLPEASSMAATSSRTILGSEEPDTAMDSLKHLIAYIPDWLERLKKLNSEPETHSGDTTPPPGDGSGTKPAEEQAPPAGPADCDNARIKRLAELEDAKAGECEGRIPSILEIYDDIYNGLSRVQSMCGRVESMGEHAAHQLVRGCDIDRQLGWARSNWRSNSTSLVHERFVYTNHGAHMPYILALATFTSFAFVIDSLFNLRFASYMLEVVLHHLLLKSTPSA
ncbi:hypothetical protein B0T25DRAFT_567490 [Lasiosphaeria hispida]|uniref:Uncharacterized protein n=1 Tax=Lasiosphaeria hispida TaxID=260671 RepID=A0AAJ0HGX1_9PEZI|nr:hypothetical protein B0T25DRAFT_567490 [Lasiosphaeria hispida]